MGGNVVITKNVQRREVTLERMLDGPQKLVWECLTTAAYIDQWWGPAGWTTKTKSMDVRVGGIWHYCMGADGAEVWGVATYEAVNEPDALSYVECASNAVGEKIAGKQQHVAIRLAPTSDSQTTITICTRFASIADLEAMMRMGMAEGYDGALDKLQKIIRKENHDTN